MRDRPIKYNITARLLHWVSALVILWATFSGFYILLFNVDENTKHQISQFNVSVVVIFMPFFCWRIIYRLKHTVPEYPQLLSVKAVKIAKAMHVLLYALVTIVLFTGILMMEEDLAIFNLFQIPHLIDDLNIQNIFERLHAYSTRVLAVCILLHIFALIKHQLKGNQILKRMI